MCINIPYFVLQVEIWSHFFPPKFCHYGPLMARKKMVRLGGGGFVLAEISLVPNSVIPKFYFTIDDALSIMKKA
jgi:hypothetical protein